MLIFDAHLDLSMNALEWNRDLTRPISELRQREKNLTDKPDRGKGTVSFPEMRRGGIGLCVATQIARYVKQGNPLPGWHSPEQAWAQTQGQLAWYRAMEEAGELVQIRDRSGLDRHLDQWLGLDASSGKLPQTVIMRRICSAICGIRAELRCSCRSSTILRRNQSCRGRSDKSERSAQSRL